jgi:hypothetical protein
MGLAAECRHAVPRVPKEPIPCRRRAPDRNVPDKDLGGGDGDRARACAAVWARPSLVLAMFAYYLPNATQNVKINYTTFLTTQIGRYSSALFASSCCVMIRALLPQRTDLSNHAACKSVDVWTSDAQSGSRGKTTTSLG